MKLPGDPEIDAYSEAHTSTPPEWLCELERDTLDKAKQSVMLSSRTTGRLLKLLVATAQPRLAVDIGTFTGYSALCIAEGLALGAKVISFELDPAQAVFAQRHIDRSPYRDRIEVKVGSALDGIRAIEQRIGFAFIDADKLEYWDYYEAVLERLDPDGLIVVDNTLFFGSVVSQEHAARLPSFLRPQTDAIAEFNRRLQQDERTEHCLLTVRDGVTLIRRRRPIAEK